jgi:dipeptidyl aminopeptidase/acylaminoacyl peptidase
MKSASWRLNACTFCSSVDNHALLLLDQAGVVSVVEVDVLSGQVSRITHTQRDVTDYTANREGTTLAFITPNRDIDKEAPPTEPPDALQSGYRISFEDPVRNEQEIVNLLYRTDLSSDGRWTTPTPISFEDPYTHTQNLEGVPWLHNLSMSPDGRKLLFNYELKRLPDTLRNSAMVRYGSGVTVLYDLNSGKTSLPMPSSEGVYGVPLWAENSQSFIAVDKPPVGSKWEQRDIAEHRTEGGDADIFWVQVETGKIEEVHAHAYIDSQGALAWLKNGDVVVQISARTIGRFHQDGGVWKETTTTVLPINNYYRYSIWGITTVDADMIVGSYETPTTPPDLFTYRVTRDNLQMVTKLNPEIDHLQLAPFREVHWRSSTGIEAEGFLFIPPDYVPGRRYPLVIQTKGNQGWFACDAGNDAGPSFQPQPIADAGIMYLVRSYPADWKQADEIADYPKGYPGQLGEAANQMDIWESAVAALDAQGLIDPTKVGIIGFSRTGWMVEFILANSKVKFAAATATDNVEYSLGEYWLASYASKRENYEAMYGGPPYGNTLKNWIDYSISFNMDKIHTPLLLESFDYGVQDNILGSIPIGLADASEVFIGLSRLGRPVELYYYPGSNHKMDVGAGHVANLNRNYDWYRFWLQDYEDPDPAKKEQYLRWRHLRELRDADNGKRRDESSTQPTLK